MRTSIHRARPLSETHARLLSTLLVLALLVYGAAQAATTCELELAAPSQQVIMAFADVSLAMAVGDLDGDGSVDVVVATKVDNTIGWLRNSGTGGFPAGRLVIDSSAVGASSVAVADVDGDGDLDVLAALTDADTIALYHNNGTGGFPFGRQVIDSTLDGARVVLTADLNGDSAPDVLAAAYVTSVFGLSSASVIAWYPNSGAGGFLSGRLTIDTTLVNPTSLAVADLDGNGALDVIAVGQVSDELVWFRSNDSGFPWDKLIIDSAGSYDLGGGDAAAVADLDGNGTPDVLFAESVSARLGWFRNNGTGGFSGRISIDAGFKFVALVAADVDRDGALDVLAGADDDSTVAMYRNDGTGAFTTGRFELSATVGASTLLAADLNGDGLVDLAFASEALASVGWFPSVSSVAFSEVVGSASVTTRPFVAVGDLNGDGAVDVAWSGGGKVGWLRNDGSGLFPAGDLTIDSGTLAVGRLAVADLNGDGSLDVLVDRATVFELYANDGTGGFAAGQQFASPSSGPATSTLTLADLNGDGAVDVIASYSSRVYLLANNGTGQFPSGGLIVASPVNMPTSVTPVDLDGDGALDLLVSSSGDHTVAWYRNDGAGSFFWSQHVVTTFATYTRAATAGDVNGDGAPDVLVTAGIFSFGVGWFRNDGSGGFNSNGVQIIDATMISASRIDVADLDNDGDLDVLVAPIAATDSMLWYQNNGTGGFGARTDTDTGAGAADFVVVDLSGDGLLDLVVALGESQSSAFVWARASFYMGTRLSRPVSAGSTPALPPECGGVANSFACVAARVTRALSPCVAATVALPPVVRGCGLVPMTIPSGNRLSLVGAPGGSAVVCTRPASLALAAVLSGASLEVANVAVTVLPSAVSATATLSLFSACTAALCDATGSASLVLRNVSMGGFRNAAPSLTVLRDLDRGYGAIAVHGSSSVSLSGCAFTGGSVGSVGAALTVFGDGASVTIGNSSFVHNTASGGFGSALGFGGGGAIAVLGAGATVALTDCALTSNAATGSPGGSGGALLLRSAGSGVTFTRVRLDGNAAALAGGAIAMIGAAQTELALSDVTLSGNTAAFGGAIAAFSSELDSASALQPSAMALMPPGGAVDGGTVILDAGCRLGPSSARYGGALFACSAQIAASAAQVTAASSASGGGGLAFRCNEAAGAVTSGDSWLALPAATGSPTAPYGPVSATPPHTAAWLAEPPRSAQSGAPWGAGSAVLTDSLDQRVAVPDLTLRLSLASAADAIGTTAVLVPTTADSSYSLALMAPSARGWPDALAVASNGLPLSFELAVDAGGVASLVPGSPVLAFTLGLTNCAAGLGRVSGDGSSTPLVCAACSGGTFSSAERAATGAPCDVCPANTIQLAASGGANATATASNCVCQAGFYSPTGVANVACVACSDGALCAGGSGPPVAAPGFFPEDGVFVACPLSSACLGASGCAAGYSGRLCGQCARGWYTLNGRCRPCRNAQTGGIAFVLVVLGLIVTAALLWFNAASGAGGEARFVAATIGLAALQVIALFGKLSIDWGPFVTGFLQVASALSLNVQLASPECSLAAGVDGWALKWALMLVLPVFAAAAVALLAVLFMWPLKLAGVPRLADLTWLALADAGGRTWYQLLVLMQLPLTAAAMSPFGCRRDESGRSIFVDDPSRVCYDARWWRLFAPAVIFSLLYGAAMPLSLALLLRRARARLDAVAFVLRYGFLAARFRDACYGTEAAVMGGKVALVIVTTFFGSADSKVGAGALVIVAAIVTLAVALPYRQRAHNWTALWCLVAIVAVLVAGTLEALVFRRVVATVAILALIVGVIAGNAADLWAFARAKAAAESAWKHSDATGVTVAHDDGLESGARSAGGDVRLEFVGAGASARRENAAMSSIDLSLDNEPPWSRSEVGAPPPLPSGVAV